MNSLHHYGNRRDALRFIIVKSKPKCFALSPIYEIHIYLRSLGYISTWNSLMCYFASMQNCSLGIIILALFRLSFLAV